MNYLKAILNEQISFIKYAWKSTEEYKPWFRYSIGLIMTILSILIIEFYIITTFLFILPMIYFGEKSIDMILDNISVPKFIKNIKIPNINFRKLIYKD